MNQLIPIESVNAVELFSDEKTLTALLDEIKKTATDFEPDVSTDKGRKEIASQAYKVRKCKTVIDKAGKEQTEEDRRRINKINTGRKHAREFCDAVCDEINAPLDAYKAKEAKLAQIAAQKAEMEADELEAHERNDLYDREAKVRAAEEKIEADRIERERIESERIAE